MSRRILKISQNRAERRAASNRGSKATTWGSFSPSDKGLTRIRQATRGSGETTTTRDKNARLARPYETENHCDVFCCGSLSFSEFVLRIEFIHLQLYSMNI